MDNNNDNGLWFSEWEPTGDITLEGGFYGINE